ncbi:MAG TPA: carbohydrate kinase family protein [Chloroflexota bacterium]|nr:carbohydrate kinase family protein [Chloroflexota bacterium]
MSNLLVCGHINLETTLRVDQFPLDYFPVRYPFFGVRSTTAGVGYNIAKALTTLGDQVRLLSLIGQDEVGTLVQHSLEADGIGNVGVLAAMPETCQSVILYDGNGRRQIHTDLKDVQSRPYPPNIFQQYLPWCDLAVLCNINFSRPFLGLARQAGKAIASDVHAISDLEDEYNRDYMAAADILFMSHERLPDSPEVWARKVQERFGTAVLVIGLGADGALLAVKKDNFMERIPAVFTRPIVNTIGAGDALFAAFIHSYLQTGNPYTAIQPALTFASYKIGAVGAAEGFLTAVELAELVNRKP